MRIISKKTTALLLSAAMALPVAGGVSAQELDSVAAEQDVAAEEDINVYGSIPSDLSGMTEGPEIDGFISAREGSALQITSADGTSTVVRISEATDIKSRGGFLGLERTPLASDALMNGLPVTVETVEWGANLIASQVRFSDGDFETAAMIQRGTAQGFAEQTAATEALRGRVGDIDNYNIRNTTNVYFDTGEWELSPQAAAELCSAAAEAEATENALLLVVGYTDSTGDPAYNQVLSERRAGRVVNHLQQQCGWAPWRMLSPTGMSEADPAAPNDTDENMAQNRRVAVNVLVSKAVEGL